MGQSTRILEMASTSWNQRLGSFSPYWSWYCFSIWVDHTPLCRSPMSSTTLSAKTVVSVVSCCCTIAPSVPRIPSFLTMICASASSASS